MRRARTPVLEVEIAVQDIEGVRVALGEGADRVELCTALGTGGLTPSAGMVERAAETARSSAHPHFVHVLVRPRPGGFCYSPEEVDVILRDIAHLRELGAAGVVVGLLDEDDHVDIDTSRRLVDAAGPLEVTFHRAIDVARQPAAAVSALAEIGVRRVLSSGQAVHSTAGIEALRSMVAHASGRIQVMAGGNIRPGDIAELATTGITAVHLSARRTGSGSATGPGGGPAMYDVTDPEIVRAAVEVAHAVRAP